MTRRYRPMYKCLLCGSVVPLQNDNCADISTENLVNITAHLANSTQKHEKARKCVPYSVAHFCRGDDRRVGAAIFAGFICVDEKGEKNGSDKRK